MHSRHANKCNGKLAIIVLLIVFCTLAGCSREDGAKRVLPRAAQMNAPEFKIGVPQSAAATTVIEKNFPKCIIEYFKQIADGYVAVKYGKIDAFAFDRHALQYVLLNNPDLALMDEKIADEFITVGSALGREELMDKVNTFIRQYRADGSYRQMYARWLLGKDMRMPEIPEPKNPTMTLTVGTTGVNEPMNFYANGQLAGFDIEFSRRLARHLNAKLVFKILEFPAIVDAAISGKIDLLIANLNATPERRKMMLFSETYVDSEITFLVRKDRLPQKNAFRRISNINELTGKKVGVITGSSYDALQKEQLPLAVPEYFNNFTDQLEALRSGKIAGIIIDEPIARDIMNKNTAVTCLKTVLRSDGYAFAFSKNRSELHRQVNAALKQMKDTGTLKKLDDKWFAKDDSGKVLPDLKNDGKNGTIRLATNSDNPPFSYMKDGKIVGYDIEIAMTIAQQIGRKLEIIDMDFGAIIPALVSGKTDMAGACITVTKERAQSVLFSTPNYSGGVLVMVASGEGARTGGFWPGLAESFRRNFLVEDRYKLVLQGLWVTVLITICASVLGTLLGFGICLMRRAKTRWANIPAKVFIRAIQGTPILVFLMILYYIVFGSVDINGILVAVIGFAVHFAAYVSEMMRTGIEAVDKGQHEAAQAIGFNKVQVFTRITFPQAARHVLPVFRGEFISMLKMTSIVGYIAIQDLTKMSDIIRSRTYEAFFPLIATALIYFVIAWFLAYLLSLVEMRIDPKQRKRIVKGIAQP